MNLKRQVLFGSAWNVLGSGGQQLISFGLFLYIARKVGPADVGLVAFAMIFIDILGVVSRFGQLEVLQRGPEPSRLTVSTSFWMLTVWGWSITAIVVAAGIALRGFEGHAAFPLVLIFLAPICGLQAWNAIPNALIRRRFNFRALAVRDWLASLVGGLVGVFLAYHDFGVFALVGQRLSNAAVQTIATWTLLRWYPKLAFAWSDARHLARFGFDITVAALAYIVNKNVADAIVGAMLGLSQLGAFRLGLRFFELLAQLSAYPVSIVAYPTFARLAEDRNALGRAYLRLTQLMALVSLPAFFGLATTADILIPTLLGPKWAGSVLVVQFLGFLITASTVNFFFAPVMVAVGRSRAVLWQSVLQFLATAIAIYVAAQFGFFEVMVAYVGVAVLVAVLNSMALTDELGLNKLSVLKTLLPPLICCAVMVGSLRLIRMQIAGLLPIPQIAILVIAGAVIYVTCLMIGDFGGLWRRYVRNAVRSVIDASGS